MEEVSWEEESIEPTMISGLLKKTSFTSGHWGKDLDIRGSVIFHETTLFASLSLDLPLFSCPDSYVSAERCRTETLTFPHLGREEIQIFKKVFFFRRLDPSV